MKKRVSNEELILSLKKYYEKYHVIPKCTIAEKSGELFSPKTYQKRFGTWNNALIKAGLELNNYRDLSKNDMMIMANDFNEKYNKSPKHNELPFNRNQIKKYWETWNDFLIDCNLSTNSNKRFFDFESEDKAKEYLLKKYNILNRVPSITDIKQDGHYEYFHSHFSNFNNLLIQLGIVDEGYFDYLNEENKINSSINNLISLYNRIKHIPSVSEYDDYVKNDKSVYCRRELTKHMHMTYRDVCNKYLKIDRYNLKSKEELIDDIKNLRKQLKRIPRSYELIDFGLSSVDVYRRVFEMNYMEFLKSLGWDLGRKVMLVKSDKELLSDYYNLFIQLNRLPLSIDVNNCDNMCTWSVYMSHFGSLENLCKLTNINLHKYTKNIDMGQGIVCIDNNGELCRSIPEMIITNILIQNNINYIKECYYKTLNSHIDGRMRTDWVIDGTIAVEYFGLYAGEEKKQSGFIKSYNKKIIKKIDLCNKYSIPLIDLYPSDLDDNYKGMIKKFAEYGYVCNKFRWKLP